MKNTGLFPQIDGLVHGGDYNPEQWLDRPDILEEDIRLMKKAGMNSATLGVFSWTKYEPEEGKFTFDWLTEIIDNLYQNGIYTVLATPSGARPAWLDAKYEEARRVDKYGNREHHGIRENHCMSSPLFRKKVETVVTKLHEAVGDHPGVILWHISNELGGECYCPLCVKRFQNYLRDKFDNDIDKLNQAWWTTFWSHNYNSFDQIEPPYANGEYSIMGLNLEWKRFTTWNMNDYMEFEIDLVKKLTPDRPVTTNFMQLYDGLDYRKMTDKLDVISWDSYPRFHNDYESLTDTFARSAFDHAVMRSMKKDRPFMLMESAPGLVNWHDFNKLKRPGIHKLFSLQAVACGSDTVQYFQWRKGRGSFEQYHGAVVDHLGTSDTRIFKEVAALGTELERLKEVAGSLIRAKAAVIFDWDIMWSLADAKMMADSTKKYPEICAQMYGLLLRLGVETDVINQTDPFDDYDVIIAPMLYMIKPGVADRMKQFVERGGNLLATYVTGYVDENTLCYLGGFPGNGLNELFGVTVEELDTYYPNDKNYVTLSNKKQGIVKDYAERIRVQDAEILGTYMEDFYAGEAAVTRKQTGFGWAYYTACRLDKESMTELIKELLTNAGIQIKELPENVEYHERYTDTYRYAFYINEGNLAAEILDVNGTELFSEQVINGKITIGAKKVIVIKEKI